MSSRKRIIFASLIAPLSAPVLYFVGLLIFGNNNFGNIHEIFVFFGVILLIGGSLSYGATLILGLPWYFALTKFGKDSSLNITFSGMVIGIIVFISFFQYLGNDISKLIAARIEAVLVLMFVGAVLGGSVAFCFAKLRA